MKKIKSINVYYQDRKVGTLARYKEQLAAFEYDGEWLKNGFSISPFSLPLQSGVFIPKQDPFEGLFGVFSDSLPDGWGRLLVDRLMAKNGLQPSLLGNIERLAIVGNSGMGALCYKPNWQMDSTITDLDLDKIAEECNEILRVDSAEACGIEMAETRLFPSERCEGYFGTKRFDRDKTEEGKEIRIHMLSASALLETSHRIPNLDYELLMKLTMKLTEDFSEIEKLYRRMCFNVFSHNRDDHSKNFSYLYDERWQNNQGYPEKRQKKLQKVCKRAYGIT